ncbi:MAG: LLM class F420-dependent oxidoreductase [Armatimonadetes bacterium]|nr:LLM class F420-dependent oxidoreductase [Armatimonadota bacterium]
MNIGAAVFVTEYTMAPQQLGPALEERGFESLWVPEHSHIPKRRKGIEPGGPDLPPEYWHAFEPFLTLAAAAATTRRLRLGTGVCLVAQRDPIHTAKAVATLDTLSQGRVLFGIGAGWNAEEMSAHGTDYRTRWRRLKESVAAMKAIWTQDEAEFHGEFCRFEPMLAFPKPVQKPHPPVLLGAHGDRSLDRVVDYCDGWMPLHFLEAEHLPERIEALKNKARAAGRDPEELTVSVIMAPAAPDTLKRLEELGAARVVLQLPSAGSDTVLPLLDRYAEMIR